MTQWYDASDQNPQCSKLLFFSQSLFKFANI